MRGVDISHYNKISSYPALSKAADFAIVKATQGHALSSTHYLFVDSAFHATMKGCIAAKLPVGCYHFFTAESVAEAVKEADFFCDAIEPYKDHILYAVCDCENYGGNKWIQGISHAELTKRINAFLAEVDRRGYRAAHYTNIDHINNYIRLQDIPYPVWVADYRQGAKKPCYDNVIAWQYTEQGKMDGITGTVDLNEGYFPGLAAIYRLHSWGVINSPAYWADKYGRISYLGELLEGCAAHITAKGARLCDTEEALASLVSQGMINTPGYWRQHMGDVAHLSELLCALGGCRYQ